MLGESIISLSIYANFYGFFFFGASSSRGVDAIMRIDMLSQVGTVAMS